MIPSGVAGQPADSRTGAAGGLFGGFTGGFFGEVASSQGEVNWGRAAALGAIEGAIGLVAGGVGGATCAKLMRYAVGQTGRYAALHCMVPFEEKWGALLEELAILGVEMPLATPTLWIPADWKP